MYTVTGNRACRKPPSITIGVVAPSRSLGEIKPENIKIGVKNLEALGYNVLFGDSAYHSLYDVDSAGARARDLMAMYGNDNVDIVMAAIGGYSSLEILPYLDYSLIRASKKPLVGFSDITALLNAIYGRTGIVTYLGPHFAVFCQKHLPAYTARSFLTMMESDQPVKLATSCKYADDLWYEDNGGQRNWKPNPGRRIRFDACFRGPPIGGNLETLLALAGTPYFPPSKGRVLLLEEANGKHPLAVRRELVQLRYMGVLDNITALVVGRFWGWTRSVEEGFWDDVTTTVLKDFRKPIITNLDFGHTDPMCTLPIGGNMVYDGTDIFIERSRTAFDESRFSYADQ